MGRAELEALAGEASADGATPLDPDTLLDLAEIRWRTGDLAGAGEAALAYADAGGRAALGFVIAAEATGSLGRPGEARRLAGLALERMDAPLDALFAGIPRSGVWPTDPSDPGVPVALFPPAAQSSVRPATRLRPARAVVSGPDPTARPQERHGVGGRWERGVSDAEAESGRADEERRSGARRASDAAFEQFSGAHEAAGPGGDSGAEASAAGAPSIWDGAESVPASQGRLDPAVELASARAALIAGRPDEAAIRLGVVLRIAPSLAPAVLDAVAGGTGPSFELIRGDAFRLVGHEIEARRAFAAAAASAASVARAGQVSPAMEHAGRSDVAAAPDGAAELVATAPQPWADGAGAAADTEARADADTDADTRAEADADTDAEGRVDRTAESGMPG